jgi:hypothetical protein
MTQTYLDDTVSVKMYIDTTWGPEEDVYIARHGAPGSKRVRNQINNSRALCMMEMIS